MIEGDLKFGAFVPRIPEKYKILSKDNKERQITSEGCALSSEWTGLKLKSIEPYNHDTSIFEFELPSSKQRLNLPVMDHLLVKAPGKEHPCHGGGDAIRPYTAIWEKDGSFAIMVKRYKEWGIPEKQQKQNNKYFLYAKTDHSYRPAGVVSNYIHSLALGQHLEFRYQTPLCQGKIPFPFPSNITSLTMIAVGVGVVPMIRIIRALLNQKSSFVVSNIRLLYGVRTVSDILCRDKLDYWQQYHSHRFKAIYCVGSRWNNVHFGAKTKDDWKKPSLPKDWETIPPDQKELGWVDADKVQRRAASSPDDPGHFLFLCGLPGIFMSLVGPRSDPSVTPGTQLYNLGYRHQVIKF